MVRGKHIRKYLHPPCSYCILLERHWSCGRADQQDHRMASTRLQIYVFASAACACRGKIGFKPACDANDSTELLLLSKKCLADFWTLTYVALWGYSANGQASQARRLKGPELTLFAQIDSPQGAKCELHACASGLTISVSYRSTTPPYIHYYP